MAFRGTVEKIDGRGDHYPAADFNLWPGNTDGQYQWRAAAGGAAHRHRFSLVIQSHRHRPPLRAGSRRAYRARCRLLSGKARTVISVRQAIAVAADSRPDDRIGAGVFRRSRQTVPAFCGSVYADGGYTGWRDSSHPRQPGYGSCAFRRRDYLFTGKFQARRAQSHRC